MPEQAWFISETAAAKSAAKLRGYDVIGIGATDGERVFSALDVLAARGARGLVICVPDVRLGRAIAHRAAVLGLKVISVDDQFVDATGRPLATVPYLGMAGRLIGEQVGVAVLNEMRARGWSADQTGLLRLTNAELPTAVERVAGASTILARGGIPTDHLFDAPLKTTDTEGGATAAAPVFAAHPEIKHWAIVSINEESVLGGVRTSEQYGLPPSSVIGVGIGGAKASQAEFTKAEPTGYFGAVAVSSASHGRRTINLLIDWIETGRTPPLVTTTTGKLMTRANWQSVKRELNL